MLGCSLCPFCQHSLSTHIQAPCLLPSRQGYHSPLDMSVQIKQRYSFLKMFTALCRTVIIH